MVDTTKLRDRFKEYSIVGVIVVVLTFNALMMEIRLRSFVDYPYPADRDEIFERLDKLEKALELSETDLP